MKSIKVAGRWILESLAPEYADESISADSLHDLHDNRIVIRPVLSSMIVAKWICPVHSQRKRPSFPTIPTSVCASSELLSCTPALSLYFSCRSLRAHILYGIPSCSRPGKLRALIKFSLGTLTERGPSFIKRRIKVIFP